MGYAVGCMGMRLTDFDLCTPQEFSEVARKWNEREEGLMRERWEQSRMQCMCMLQPYSSKRLEPRDVMRFPWDEVKREKATAVSAEEAEARYRAAKAARGIE